MRQIPSFCKGKRMAVHKGKGWLTEAGRRVNCKPLAFPGVPNEGDNFGDLLLLQEELASPQMSEFDEKHGSNHLTPQLADEVDGGAHRPTRGEEVVGDDDALPGK